MRYLTIVLTMFALSVLLAHPRAICNAPFTSGDEENDTSVFRPKILGNDVRVDPILNNADPVFTVHGILVKIPGLLRKDSAQVCTIEVGVNSSNVRDLKTDSTYTVIVAGIDTLHQESLERIQKAHGIWRPPPTNQRELPDELLPEPPNPPKSAEIDADTLRYCATVRITLKLVGGKIPLRKGQVKGYVSLILTATFVDSMGVVHRSSKTQPIMISN